MKKVDTIKDGEVFADIYEHKGELYVPLSAINISQSFTDKLSKYGAKATPKQVDKATCISDIKSIKEKFKYSNGNHLQLFKAHSTAFYNFLADKLVAGKISLVDIEEAFSRLSSENINLITFLSVFPMSIKDTLQSFIFIVNDGMIAFSKEAMAAGKLADWISTKKCSISNVEECFTWITVNKTWYSRSLTSVLSCMADFKNLNQNSNKNSTEDSSDIVKRIAKLANA